MRHTLEQIAMPLGQAESGMAVVEIIGKPRIPEQTFYWWKRAFVGRIAASGQVGTDLCRRRVNDMAERIAAIAAVQQHGQPSFGAGGLSNDGGLWARPR